ncbi:MAG: glycosyltransferase family 4 protein [Hyphomicrobiales bacterium]
MPKLFPEGAAIHAPSSIHQLAHVTSEPGPSAGRVCIVTGEIAGPDFNGGIGTSNRGLALALQSAGFTVDVLYTQVDTGHPYSFRGSFEEQVAAFRALGINLLCIQHQGKWDDWLGKSLRVMESLQSRTYDVAFFDDTHGTAYYSALAKRSGSPAFAHTQIVVVTHSATQWICELNQSAVRTLSDIRLLEIERRSIELADYVVSPSAYILRKYKSYGWTLPPKTLVRPNILPFSTERAVPPRRKFAIDEIVFFGRIERRKGVWLFCEVIDRLKYELAGRKVSFLGKFTNEDGESTGFGLLRRSAEWPFSPSFLYSYDRDQALAYLKGGNRLAVMPSREDNSPCVILECLIEGIPFMASSGSGGQELISEADIANCTFEATADALTAKLSAVLKDGATTGQPSFDPQENSRQAIAWVSGLVAEARASLASAARRTDESAAARLPMPKSLLLLAPEDMSAELVRDSAREVALRHPDCRVMVFQDERNVIAGNSPADAAAHPDNLRFFTLQSFASEMREIQSGDGMLVLCRLDQPVSSAILERGEEALRKTRIDALTVMRGHAIENAKPENAYLCVGEFRWEPERFKTGNTRALLALAQDSSAGLVILRSKLASILTRVSPRDPQLCRMKDIELYVHEVLLELSADGGSFELMPDCFLTPAAMPPSRESFELPRITMRHLQKTKNMRAGSEAALLSRLSVEIFMAEDAHRNAEGLVADLTSRLGEGILAPQNYWDPEQAFANYAKVAHAAGRPGLALSLIASSLTTGNQQLRITNVTPARLADLFAKTIDLAALVAAGRYTGMNVGHEWSMRVEEPDQVLELHPNSGHEGDATLIFSSLSLPAPALFTADLSLPDTTMGPVEFSLELQSSSGESLSQQWTLEGGERKTVEFAVPKEFPAECDVLLSTRMKRRRDATMGANAKWIAPAFRPC